VRWRGERWRKNKERKENQKGMAVGVKGVRGFIQKRGKGPGGRGIKDNTTKQRGNLK